MHKHTHFPVKLRLTYASSQDNTLSSYALLVLHGVSKTDTHFIIFRQPNLG